MEGYILIIVIACLGGIVYFAMRNPKKSNSLPQEVPETFEEKMLFLQGVQNKRLRSINNTLDWFFWIMIIGFVLTFLNFVMTELNA